MRNRNRFTTISLCVLITFAAPMVAGANEAKLDCGPQSMPIYLINPGSQVSDYGNATQDRDIDLVEYLQMSTGYSQTALYVVENYYNGMGHADKVMAFARMAGGSPNLWDIHGLGSFDEILDNMANGPIGPIPSNSVLSFSIGDLQSMLQTGFDAIMDMHNDGIIIVAAQGDVLWARPQEWQEALANKGIRVYVADSEDIPSNIRSWITNTCFVHLATKDAEARYIACPGPVFPPANTPQGGLQSSGSFTTPMMSAITSRVVGILSERDGLTGSTLSDTALRLIMASCDRPDAGNFAVYENAVAPSYGPWSETLGYGYVSGYKAVIYALGHGELAAVDGRDDFFGPQGVQNPPTVFSAPFEMRGDLSVPVDQTFVVDSTGSVDLSTSATEGQNYGASVSLKEIVVSGEMVIRGSVSASVIVESGGNLIIEESGSLNIAEGQSLAIQGSFTNNGTLNIDGQLGLAPTAEVTLNADLVINTTGTFTANGGASITVGDVDLGATGDDPDEVEIVSLGNLMLGNNQNNPMTITSVSPGTADWSGFHIDASGTGYSVLNSAEISDAHVALEISNSMPTFIQYGAFTRSDVGMKINARNSDTISNCSFSDCGYGIQLLDASPAITACTISDGDIALVCDGNSDPVVRQSSFLDNSTAVKASVSSAVPDLGTMAAPGLNTFSSRLTNASFVLAWDPDEELMAQYNWWGTTKSKSIAAKIIVVQVDAPNYGVTFDPFLTSAPAGAALADDDSPVIDNPVKASVEPRVSFVHHGQQDRSGGATGIAFRTAISGPTSLVVYDLRGREVRRLVDGHLDAGEHKTTWDGRDGNGRRAATGVYLARLVSGPEGATTKISLVR